jgi:ubiquinone/menaquinone biosynthesis C-methylase UbiE
MGQAKIDPVLKEYAKLAPQYDSRWAFYVRSSVENTLARLPLRGGDRVLDVGCGTGQLLAALQSLPPHVELFGVDLSSEMLSVARFRLANVLPLVAARAEQLPFRSATFDWVVSTSVFHYIREPGVALGEFHRLLKPNGSVVITDWCDDYLACKVCNLFLRGFSRSHFRSYTRDQCERLLRESSFEPVLVDRYRISRIWGLMTARAERRASARSPAPPSSSPSPRT